MHTSAPVPVAVRGCWSTVHTSSPLTATGCSCLPKLDLAHIREQEEGQSSQDELLVN